MGEPTDLLALVLADSERGNIATTIFLRCKRGERWESLALSEMTWDEIITCMNGKDATELAAWVATLSGAVRPTDAAQAQKREG